MMYNQPMNIKLLLIGLGAVILVGLGAVIFSVPKAPEVVTENKYSDLIRVDTPVANAGVKSPLVVQGSARGSWYFEASFPVKLLDANGKELVSAPSKAQGEWMTEEFVPFVAILVFETPTTKTGTIVLKNDNPSGLPENEKEVRIPVQFLEYKEVRSAKFDKPILLNTGDRIIFPDDLILDLTKINDSRCKEGVACVWIGELSVVLRASGGKFNSTPKEITIGTSINKEVSFNDYTFSLLSATESTATILVSVPSPVESGIGSVTGHIYLGPTCPVQQEPPDPRCAVKPYANATVEFLSKTSGASVKSVTSDSAGNFEIKLEAGTYLAVIYPKITRSLPSCPTTEVIVTAQQTTAIDISCDTGIR